MCYIKQSPVLIRKNITWPSGPPSRLFKEEGVKQPPQDAGRSKAMEFSAGVGGAAKTGFAPGDLFSPPGRVRNSAPSLSGDPSNPRPPTRDELILLLKGCDASGGDKHCRS